jgi:lathosterol oxidase
VVIFSIVGVGSFQLMRHGWTRMYFHFDQHSALWFWVSIGCAILMHDTWFYWTHRMMHHRRLFKYFHRTHHLSHNPTPWAAYAFDPAEAVVQALIFPLAMMFIPMHIYAFGIFMMWQIAFNIAGHSGYEINPRWLMKTPIRYLLNTPTNHIMHHEKMRGNYGLYFNVWDRLMGTNHADYEARYTEVASRSKNVMDSKMVGKSSAAQDRE